ncbi:MAG: hypothetical protein ABW047_05655 [Nitrospiraceae bacterium]
MTRYVGLSLYACSVMLIVGCQSAQSSQEQDNWADRTSNMAKSTWRDGNQTPRLRPIDQPTLERFRREEPQFREHYAIHYAGSGSSYNQYRPAYRYGYELSTNERYETLNWSTLEQQAHRGWNDAMGLWDWYKEAVRFGWERGMIREQG